LDDILATTRWYRERRYRSATLIAATFRGWVAWREYMVIIWAVYIIQQAWADYRQRKQAEVRPLDLDLILYIHILHI
jgi:hypothetical protein